MKLYCCTKCESKVSESDVTLFDIPDLYNYQFEQVCRKLEEERNGGPLPQLSYHKVTSMSYSGGGSGMIGCQTWTSTHLCGPLRPWTEDDDYRQWVENDCSWEQKKR